MKGLRWVVRDDFIEWGSFSTVVDERVRGFPSEGTVSVAAGPQAQQWVNTERRTGSGQVRTGNDRQVGHK